MHPNTEGWMQEFRGKFSPFDRLIPTRNNAKDFHRVTREMRHLWKSSDGGVLFELFYIWRIPTSQLKGLRGPRPRLGRAF